LLIELLVKVKEYQSLLTASLKAGIPHYHACGGKAKCTTCRILVLGGAEYLDSPLIYFLPDRTNFTVTSSCFAIGGRTFFRLIRKEFQHYYAGTMN
jgi:Na+-transporting NADH:ubiquinone oxidoreductase subunit NqrF